MSYKGKKAPAPIAHRHANKKKEIEYESSNDEEDMSSEIEEEIGEEQKQGYVTQEQAEIDAAVAPDETRGKHITTMLTKNANFIDIDLDVVASLNELDAGHVSAVVSIPPEHLKHLKQNMAQINRHEASDEHLAGDTRRMFITAATILSHANDGPIAVEWKTNAMLARSLHSNGAAWHRIQPGTKWTALTKDVFSPVSIMDEEAYQTGMVCTPEVVNETITIKEPSKNNPKGSATVTKDSLAHRTIRSNINSSKLDRKELTQDQIDNLFRKNYKGNEIEIPLKFAKELKAGMLAAANDVLARCIDAEKDLVFTLAPSNGNERFGTVAGLHGQVVGSEIDADVAMNRRNLYHTTVRLTYGTF